MEETYQPQFRGVWIPADILTMQEKGQLKAVDIILLAIIDSLVAPNHGCYASNEYLGKRIGLTTRNVQVHIAKLKKMGLVRAEKTGAGTKRRHLVTAWSRTQKEGDENVVGGVTISSPPNIIKKYNTMSGAKKAPDGAKDVGFGLVQTATTGDEDTTDFDMEAATKLKKAVARYLGVSHPIVKRCRVLAWARNFKLLRTQDATTEKRITEVLDWYTKHMGEEFVPQAFAGESFRKKFHAIERQCGRNVAENITTAGNVTEEAIMVAKRLSALRWPAGSEQHLVGAVQASLTAYEEWLVQLRAFLGDLEADTKSKKYGRHRKRLIAFGAYWQRTLPHPQHFVRRWFEEVWAKVKSWENWGGSLSPYIFSPEAKQFKNMGRAAANNYANDPARFDAFMEAMQNEDKQA